MRFSLIVATLSRVEELRELFRSLAAQTFGDFEVIVVDQNSDDRLSWTGAESFSFPVTRIRSQIRHLSNARNLGLRKSSGDIVCFPDDDCVYPPDLLAFVDQEFSRHPELCVRTGPVVAELGGSLSSGRWRKQSGPIDIWNVWTSVIAANIFILRDVALSIGGFDERLGIGSVFGAVEDNDLVARAVAISRLGWYDTAQIVVHPEKSLSEVIVRRAFTYGAGLGYALRKNKAPVQVCLNFMIRPLVGTILYFITGQSLKAEYHWRTLLGRIFGFRACRTVDRSLPQTWTWAADATGGTDVK